MNTEKRLALSFALSILVILAFSWYNAKKFPPKPIPKSVSSTPLQESSSTPTASVTAPEEKAKETISSSTAPQTTSWSWIAAAPEKPATGEVIVESELYRVTFSKTGAIPRSWQLLRYEELYSDPRYLRLEMQSDYLPNRQKAGVELGLWEKSRELSRPPVEMIVALFGPGGSGLMIQWGDHHTDRTIPYECVTNHVVVKEPTDLRFVYQNAGITMEKTYRFYPDSYHLDFQVRIENGSGQPISFDGEDHYDVFWYGGLGYPSLRPDKANSLHLQLGGKSQIIPADALLREIMKNPALLMPEYKTPTLPVTSDSVSWVGVTQKYFLAAIVPLTPTKIAFKGISSPGNAATQHVMEPHVGVRMDMKPILNGATQKDQFTVYVGPLEEGYLQKAAAGLEEARQIFLRSFTGPITHLMLRLLQGFYAIVPNYGVGIILLTLLVKILMFPLYHKQMQSMKKMQALQPHINALKEKYKDEPQKMQKEQMELFRKHKVNPLGGCLTMLPTIPIFIALYATFGMALELRGAPFFGWIKDLSAPDGAFYIPVSAYIIPINILPIAYALLTLWSTSQQKVEGPNATTMKIMPLIFVYFFWTIASGVILYFVISIFIDVTQRIVTDKLLTAGPSAEKAKA